MAPNLCCSKNAGICQHFVLNRFSITIVFFEKSKKTKVKLNVINGAVYFLFANLDVLYGCFI